MTRDGICLALCAFVVLAVGPQGRAGEEDREKIVSLLRVQTALRQGRENLQRGHYQAAVQVLESQLKGINGDKDYLNALRDAYLGLVRELQQAKRPDEADLYVRRLESIDPGALLEVKMPRPAAATPAAVPAPQATKAPAPAAMTARGKIDDSDDPFSDKNRRQMTDVRKLLEQAETAFSIKAYERAQTLFEQAHTADRQAAAGCVDQWAYCKLFAVVQALNRPGVEQLPANDLEREVRQAMSLSPKMELFGKDLLNKITERCHGAAGSATPGRGPSVSEESQQVRHQPRQGQQGWAVAETTNFRIFHNQSTELAERVAQIAEATRSGMARKWFGSEPAEAWSPRCDVYLHPTAQDYSRATSQPADCPGHSTMSTEGERVLSRRIDLHCDDRNMLAAVLPHETTHVVLAGRFPAALPRWADEGMAVLTEPREFIERHLRNLPTHHSSGQLFTMERLLQLAEYPEPRQIGAFYAQSISVVDFLSRQRGPLVFTEFVRDGMRGGYEAALRKHYGMQGFKDLEQRWLAGTFSQGGAMAAQKR